MDSSLDSSSHPPNLQPQDSLSKLWVVLKVKKGGDANREEEMPSSNVQKIVGFLIAAYGFFVAVYPQDYILRLIPNLTITQTNTLLVVLLLIGAFLLLTDRRIIGS